MRIEESRALFCHAERAWRDIEHKYLRRTSANGTMKMKISSVDRKKRTLYTFLHGVKPIVFKGLEGRATFYYPNLWGTMPMSMFTFLERCDLSGKRIFPFCTNEGSGMGGSERDLKRICKGAVVEKGLTIHGAEAADSRSKVETWVKKQM